jgi:hypothetical protein
LRRLHVHPWAGVESGPETLESSGPGGLHLGLGCFVSADRADQVQLRCAAHAGDLGPEGLRDLHHEPAHAAGRADHQDAVSRPKLRDVPECLQRGDSGDGDRRGLFEAESGRLAGQLLGPGDREHRERALGFAHHLVAGPQAGDLPPTAYL